MARASRTPKIRLGELLVAAGLVNEDKVRIGLEEQRRNNLFLGEALVQLGFVSEEAIAQAIIQHFNLPFLSASQFTIPPEVFNLFPERMYNEYQFIAVDKIERVIIIIAAGPINQDMMEELERVSECKICHYVSTWRDINAAISRNTKELGGDAQIELTGLGSMLLDNPNASQSKTGTSITQKIKRLETGPTMSSPMFSRPTSTRSPATKTLASPNMSAMLSPLSLGITGKSGVSQVAASTPPSPRLTAFLKVPPPGASVSSSGLSGIYEMASPNNSAPTGIVPSANMSAVFAAGSMGLPSAASTSSARNHGVHMSSAGLPAVSASSAGMPAVKKDGDGKIMQAQPPKRMSSFLQIRKQDIAPK